MALLCPLCLKRIRSGDRFFVYCRSHSEASDPIDYQGNHGDLEQIQCHKPGDCNEKSDVWTGVFVAHENCTFKNPFMETTSTDIEVAGRNVSVSTAETQLLLDARAVYPKQPAMWYPLALLRAINDTDRVGRLVLLAGPVGVGKSIIATMAMNPKAYIGSNTKKFAYHWPSTYVSVGSLGAADLTGDQVRPAFLGAVNAVAKLQSDEPGAASVPATVGLLAFLRVVFFTRSAPHRERTLFGRVRGVWRGVTDVFKQIGYAARGKSQMAPVVTAPTVGLLDWAGERFWRKGDRRVAEIVSDADVIAVVIDGQHLVELGHDVTAPDTLERPDSIRHACQRLAQIEQQKACVIVTKLDMVAPERRGPGANRYLEDLAKHEDRTLDEQTRAILAGWLELGRQRGAEYEGRLLEHLESHRRMPVFFIHTTNLNGATLGADQAMPRSVGLARFILWVLGRLDEDGPPP